MSAAGPHGCLKEAKNAGDLALLNATMGTFTEAIARLVANDPEAIAQPCGGWEFLRSEWS